MKERGREIERENDKEKKAEYEEKHKKSEFYDLKNLLLK